VPALSAGAGTRACETAGGLPRLALGKRALRGREERFEEEYRIAQKRHLGPEVDERRVRAGQVLGKSPDAVGTRETHLHTELRKQRGVARAERHALLEAEHDVVRAHGLLKSEEVVERLRARGHERGVRHAQKARLFDKIAHLEAERVQRACGLPVVVQRELARNVARGDAGHGVR
jgi:hypothetical protein